MHARCVDLSHRCLSRRCVPPIAALALSWVLSGCAVVSVAGAAAGAAISVAGAVVSTGVTVTGKAVGKAIDVIGGDDEATKAAKAAKAAQDAAAAAPATKP
jgi:hypothetical protein